LITPELRLRLNRFTRLRPTPRQAAFLLLPHREALYGGAVGGGKSLALLMAALQYVDVPGYNALIVRKSYPMLAQPGGLIFAARKLLLPMGVAWNASETQFLFPSGATLTFRHFEDQGAGANFQGGEFHFIGVDEATDFSEEQVLFLSSRLRRSPEHPFPLRLRLTAYPNGPGKEWIYRRYVLEGTKHGRPFVESRLEDNPYVDLASYDEWLRGLGHIRYEQFRRGNWTIREEGTLFKPAWFDDRYIQENELPSGLKLCRAWDTAASDGAGDYTAGVLLGRSKDGVWYVIDVRRIRRSPLGVERFIKATAERDEGWAKAHGYRPPVVVMEQEPASAGKGMIDHYRRNVLPAHDFRSVSPSGSKQWRAEIVSARAEAKDIFICRGDWIGEFLDELATFPQGSHDDQVDALSAAYGYLGDNREILMVAPIGILKEEPGWLHGASWSPR
jgi:predicted phage terminase large subunit-like protein